MKINKLNLLVLGILLISGAVAQIELSPSTLSLNAYPGETVLRNISIETLGNYLVYINSSLSEVVLNYTSPIIVEKHKTIQVAFSFPKDIAPGVYSINLSASTEVYTEIVKNPSSSNSGSGGGVRVIYKNKTVYRNGVDPVFENMTNDLLIENEQLKNEKIQFVRDLDSLRSTFSNIYKERNILIGIVILMVLVLAICSFLIRSFYKDFKKDK